MKKKIFMTLLISLVMSMGFAQIQSIGSAKKAAAQKEYAVKKSGGAVNSVDAFYKKWGTKWNYWCQGVTEYGWPKAFFTDMQRVMPERFQMEKVGTQSGMTAYQFVFHVQGNQTYEGTLVFQGSKLYACDLNSFG